MWNEDLRQRRHAQTLSLRRTGTLAGLSPQTVQGIESGATSRPRIDVVARHARALGARFVLAPRRPVETPTRRTRPPLPGAPRTRVASEADPATEDVDLLAAELRWVRRELGPRRSRREVATAAGISEATLRRLESSEWPHPRIDKLERVALELGHDLVVEDADHAWRARAWQKATTANPDRPRGSRAHIPAEQTDLWNTPRDLLESLRAELGGFHLDVAALATTTVATAYLGPDHPDPRRRDALAFQHWADLVPPGSQTFCNPPYSLLPEFTRVAAATAERGITTVALLPVRSSARFWHARVLHQPGVEVRYLPGRLKFVDASGRSDNAALFASAIVVFWGAAAHTSQIGEFSA